MMFLRQPDAPGRPHRAPPQHFGSVMPVLHPGTAREFDYHDTP